MGSARARVGDYEIVGPLGSGGMSDVYRARDLTLGCEVAIKVLPAVARARSRQTRAFPGNEGRWQVSTDSGNEPMWSRDGKELFYRAGASLMVVDGVIEPSFEPAKPRVLFDAPYETSL